MSDSNDNLRAYTLGETALEFEVDGAGELAGIVRDMAEQGRRCVRILSRHLDAPLYDSDAFVKTLSALVRRSRYAEVQILVHDSTPAVRDGHRLIGLHQHLSSYVRIRQIHSDYKDYNHAFMIVDDTGLVFRKYADRHEASVCYHAPLQARELAGVFDDIWQISQPDPQVRRLYI